MQDSTRACIVTAYAPNTSHGQNIIGSPYTKGQKRLLKSLNHHGFRHDVLAYSTFPNDHYDKTCGYNIKASAMYQARYMGYDVILWLDCSVWAVAQIEPIFDYIMERGWYFHSNGFDLGQTMNSDALEYFGLTREQGYRIPDLSSSMFGLHLGNPKGEHALKDWLETARLGMWSTSRVPINGDPKERFVGDRQDQSCLSAIMHKRQMEMLPRGHFSDIANRNGRYSDTCIFVMRGM